VYSLLVLIYHSNKKNYMKNFKKIFLLTLIAGLVFSCDDAYDIIQKGEFQENIAFENLTDMSLALTEIYDNVYNEDEIAFTSIFTDETAIGDQNGGQNLTEYRHQIFATNEFASGIWLQNYALINYINRLIKGSESVILDETSDTYIDDLEEKNRILAEARVLRAFATLQLLTYYSTDLKNDSALGVIILDHVPTTLPNLEELPRSTNLECFNFINADLDYADENLTFAASVPFVTRKLVTAIRARMAAYRGHYTEAGQFAQAVIDASNTAPNAGTQGLVTAAVYPEIWADGNAAAEQIFSLERPSGKSGIVSNWFFNGATLDGGAFLDMSRTLYAALTQYPGDVRADAFIGTTSLIASNYATVFDYKAADVIVIGKYPGNEADNLPLNNRIKLVRTVEMHFIKAEAQVAAGDIAGAQTTINFIRTKRGAPSVAFTTTQAAWKGILDERRIELCFEGHRYIDLKRLGADAGVTGIDRYVRDCEPYSACELLITDHRFTLPIPNDELNGNSVIRAQQNPGY
jgi:hypothetical protein